MQNMIVIGGGLVGAAVIGTGVWYLGLRRGKQKNHVSKKLATSLRDEKVKGDIILNTIEDGVVFIDEQGAIQLCNPGAATITGWKAEDTIGLDWKSVFVFLNSKGEQVDTQETPFGRALLSGLNVRDNTANISTKSNQAIAVNFSVSPIVDNDTVTGMVGIFRDVSEERQEETQRAEFISTASHEMRTPVAAIEGYLSLALNDKVATIDTRAKDYLEKAHASTKHLGQLFQDLLTSAKAEDGRLTNHPTVIEVGAFMEQLTSDLHFAAEKKNLATEFLIGNNSVAASNVIDASSSAPAPSIKVVRPLYYVVADPDRLREVITNLFDNACKYTDKGKISLGLTGNDKVVQVYVRDTGNGIPPENVPHLFQKFYRVDNSATRTIGGTGLGLFICRKIIELYHGKIWVESKLNEGSTFYINLPRLTPEQAEQIKQQQTNAPANAPATAASADAPATSPAVTVAPTGSTVSPAVSTTTTP